MIQDLALADVSLGVTSASEPMRVSFFSMPYISVREVQEKVAYFYNLTLDDMKGPERVKRIAHPRQVAMYLARKLTKATLPDLARRFGNRDHTTIMHGIRAVEQRLIKDATLRQEVAILRERLAR